MNLSQLKVLVIDDSEPTRALLTTYLKELKVHDIYEAVSVQSAMSLLDILQKEKVHLDLIIIDWHMPESLGADFIKSIHKKSYWSLTHLMVLTADTNFDVFNTAINLGVSGFLTKPITKTELQKKIPEVLESRYSMKKTEENKQATQKDFTKNISEKEYNYLKGIFESLNDFVLLVDSNGYILKGNHHFFEVIGLSENKIFGVHFKNLFQNKESEKMWKHLISENSSPVRTHFKVSENELCPVLLSSSKMKTPTGDVEAYVISAKDLTTEIALQNQLMESAKMASIGKLASGLAHEINNPLSIIIGYAQSVLIPKPGESLDINTVKKASDKIIEAAKRISTFIQGLKDFSNDDMYLPMEEKDINELIEGALVYCQKKFLAHNIQFHVEKMEPAVKVMCRPPKIQQAILNVLNNAYEVIKDQPTEQIIEIRPKLENNTIKITFSNSGPQIPANLKNEIFEPYFFNKKGPHKDWGLSNSKKVVLEHRGQLYIQSHDKQTYFVMELPKVA